MDGPPIEIHVEPSTTPKACRTPASIPLHWQQRVYEDLLRDEALGVIECIPYSKRITQTTESLKAHSKPLRPLSIGEQVFLQNQQGHHPTKWDRSGTVVESTGHDQYRVNVDGSGCLTLRNRRFLRA